MREEGPAVSRFLRAGHGLAAHPVLLDVNHAAFFV
jgi:hypothetical protein